MRSTVLDARPEPSPAPDQPPSKRSTAMPSALRHGGTLVWRGLVKTMRSPEALIDVTLQPVIFLLLFVYVFGGAIAGDPHTYLQFALPGVLVQSVLFASIGTGVSLCEDRQAGIFDRFRSLPVSRAAPLLGAIGADLIRYLTSGVIMLAVGVALGFRFASGSLAVVAGLGVVIAFAFALCWAFIVLGLVVRDPRSVQGISMLITLPLTFGSTVFVPAATMPWWLRALAEINPVSQAADALRGLFLGGPVAAPVTSVLIWTALVMGIFAPLAVALYRKRA